MDERIQYPQENTEDRSPKKLAVYCSNGHKTSNLSLAERIKKPYMQATFIHLRYMALYQELYNKHMVGKM